MQQSHSGAQRERHHRAPRVWPLLRSEPIIAPIIKPESAPQLTSLFVTAASVLGIGVAALFLNRSGGSAGGLGIGLLLVSGATALVSSIVALSQYLSSRRRNQQLLRLYRERLNTLIGENGKEGEAARALREEAEARRANDLPLVAADAATLPQYSLPAGIATTRIEQIRRHPGALWQRRASDPDFLSVRIGVGDALPRVQVKLSEEEPAVHLPDRDRAFAEQHQRALSLVAFARRLTGVPIVIPLREHSSVAVVADGAHQDAPSGIVRALLGQIALRHSPYEAQITVIAPEQRSVEWNWIKALSAGIVQEAPALIAAGSPTGAAQLEQLHAILSQREQRLIERPTSQGHSTALLPHLVIVVDTLLSQDAQSGRDLLSLAPIALALRSGAEMGVTVISTHATLDAAPAQSTLAINANKMEALILKPDQPEAQPCLWLDTLSQQECQYVTRILSRYEPQRDGERELPVLVDLLTLFSSTRLNPENFDIDALWQRGRARLDVALEAPAFAVPIGSTTAPEPLMLDFVKDGPHGLLIGKTGSGKSELLRSIIAALAILYPPDKVNFVLVDYKGGLGLDAYAGLPHTLAFLTNLQQPGQTTRFLAMLESEIRSRQEKRRAKESMPRLFVIIDEFAEMVARHGPMDTSSDLIMEQVLRILRLGRQLDVHLLFASQRPESAFAKLRGYVQYRISLRTDSEEDSKEIIGRPDAATLPAAYPGRGYLLRGDYQLQMFQAARVALPLDASSPAHQRASLDPDAPATNDELIVARLQAHTQPSKDRWPNALPTPEQGNPSPLVLYIHGRLRRISGAWGSSVAAPARPETMVSPIGWYDRPDQREQGWFHVDLLGHQGALRGGPLLVTGDLNAGKTTTLQTLLLFFATQYSPDELRWFVIDPTGVFQEFAAMAQARDVVEPGLINSIDGGSDGDFQGWRARLKRVMDMDPASRPRILMLVDDYDEVAQRMGQTARTALHEVTYEAIRGRPRGVYLALSAAKQGFDTLPGNMVSAMGTKIVLHMNNKDAMAGLLGGRIPTTLEPAPGRGFVQTRASLDQLQVAAPVYSGNEVERMEGIRAVLSQSRWRTS